MSTSIRAFAIDCDGTLFNRVPAISLSNQTAFRKLQQTGCLPFFSTSRSLKAISSIVKPNVLEEMNYSNFSPGVYMNGCYVLGRGGKVLCMERMTDQQTLDCIQIINKLNLSNHSFVAGHTHLSSFNTFHSVAKKNNLFTRVSISPLQSNLNGSNQNSPQPNCIKESDITSQEKDSQKISNLKQEDFSSLVTRGSQTQASNQVDMKVDEKISDQEKTDKVSFSKDTLNATESPAENEIIESQTKETPESKFRTEKESVKENNSSEAKHHFTYLVNDDLNHLDCVTILVNCKNDNIESTKAAILAVLPSTLNCVQVSPEFIEICITEINKKTGVELILKDEGIDFSSCAAIGDSENDLPMLRSAAISFAMGNAKQACKDIANYTVSSCDNNGFAEAVKIVLEI